MRTRSLGSYTVTAVGGGELDLATSAARGVASRDVEHALHEAIALGITLFDVVADADSEKLAGDGVRAQRARDHVVLATRVPALSPAARPGGPRRDPLPERLPVGHVQQRVEASLRATRLDALPLAQLALQPAWRASPAWPELVGTCARLVREGKVIAWGALVEELGDLEARGGSGRADDAGDADDADDTDDGAAGGAAPGARALQALGAEPWLAALSVVYHLCDRRPELVEPLFEAAGKRDLAILARRPLAGGALAGNLGPGVHLPLRDDRLDLDAATLERIAVAVARLAPFVEREPPAARSCDAARRLLEPSSRRGGEELIECHDVAELALRFAIDRAGVALPRLHRREHLPAALAAAAAPPLSAALIARLIHGDDDRG